MFFWKKKKIFNTGAMGEELACRYLKKNGYKIVERNYKNKMGKQIGEIDIIAEKDKMIVFEEVKTRELQKFKDTLPEENITPSKLKKLNRIAYSYIRSNQLWNRDYRFDALSVWLSKDYKQHNIKHIESIFI